MALKSQVAVTSYVTLSVAIVTYQREQVLVDTIAALLALDLQPLEILVIDQTLSHIEPVQSQLQAGIRLRRFVGLPSPHPVSLPL